LKYKQEDAESDPSKARNLSKGSYDSAFHINRQAVSLEIVLFETL
jgi:hypothetical protein